MSTRCADSHWLEKTIELLGTDKNGVIVVPQHTHVKHTMLATVLPEDLAKRFIKNREITFPDGNTLHLCAEKS